MLREPLAADTEVHPAALAGLERAVRLLEGLGHTTEEIPAPFTPAQWTAFMPLWTVGAATIPLDETQEAQLLELTRWLRAQGRAYSGVELAGAFAGVQALARRTLEVLGIPEPTSAGERYQTAFARRRDCIVWRLNSGPFW